MKSINKLSCVLLIGGKGTRYSKLDEPPKQLIKIHKNTLIENLIIQMKDNGIDDFIFPLGYKKNYFYNFFCKKKKIGKYKINVLFSKKDNKKSNCINLRFFNAGKNTSKLNRINKSLKYINNEVFFVTYGDGLSNVNLLKVYKLYLETKKLVISTTQMNSQYGHLKISKNNIVENFYEKPKLPMPVNIGYYLFTKTLFNKYYSQKYELETSFLNEVIKNKNLTSYFHKGYFFNIDKKIDLLKIKKKYKNIIKLF